MPQGVWVQVPPRPPNFKTIIQEEVMALWNPAEGKTKVKRTKEEGCSICMTIEAPVERVSESFHDATVQIQSRAQAPGFRQGKVPLDVVKKQFASNIRERAADIAIRKTLKEAFESEKINAVGSPLLKKIDFEENKPLKMEIEVEVFPTVEPKNYTGVKATKKVAKITDTKLQETLNGILENSAKLEPETEGVAIGDEHFVIVDYTAFKGDKEASEYSSKDELVDMSSPQTIEGLTKAIKGAKKGEEREFETEIQKEKVKFKVTPKEIKKKVLPPLDDEFAKKMKFESADKLKEHVKTMMQKDEDMKNEKEMFRQIEDALIKDNVFELPKSLIEAHLERSMQRLLERIPKEQQDAMPKEQMEQLKANVKPAIERDLKIGILLNSIAKKEDLIAKDEDFNKELEESLTRTQNEEDKTRVKKFFEERKPDILATITERKVLEFLKNKAEIKEEAA
jgi:trigger factor